MAQSSLGIQRLYSIEMCVHETAPWMDYFSRGFGMQHIAVSTGAFIEKTGTCQRLLRCKDISLVLSEPIHAGSVVKRFLDLHPEGIRRVNFLVDDVEKVESSLLERHATLKEPVQCDTTGGNQWKSVSIATPLGDIEFGFVETTSVASSELGALMPGMEQSGAYNPAHNPLGLVGVDHLTSNVQTLMPVVAFYEHVMGFERFWDMRFHAEDFRPGVGSGLQSVVMWDRESGVRFACNEPLRPRFNESQVQLSIDRNRGPGFQQIAFQVEDLIAAVDHCRSEGVEFLPTPRPYYRALPARLKARAIPVLPESLEEYEHRGILIDGDKDGYLLQVFCREQGLQFNRPNIGPLLIELAQRCGDQGFGGGNFRALFEAVERQQENGY